MAERQAVPSRPRLSGIVITRNEAGNLDACLQSLSFCDEIVVVDSGSTDGSQEIVRRHGARLIERDWPGFGPQKEFARQEAAGEWILSIDADERVTPALRQEIETALAAPAADAYELPVLSTVLGREMWHSGYWPDYHLRLFRKDVAQFSLSEVHEGVVTDRPVLRLKEPLKHHPVRRLADLLRKVDSYSTLGARTVVAKGRPVGPSQALTRGAFAFFKTYVLKRGFLDGAEGLMNAAAHSQTVFWKYAKAWEAQRPKPDAQSDRSDA